MLYTNNRQSAYVGGERMKDELYRQMVEKMISKAIEELSMADSWEMVILIARARLKDLKKAEKDTVTFESAKT